MDHCRHHAILVTSRLAAAAWAAHGTASRVFRGRVPPLIECAMKGYVSCFVPPDGSKETDEISDEGDRRHEKFIGWLIKERYADDNSPYPLGEILDGGEDGRPSQIVADSQPPRKSRGQADETHCDADRPDGRFVWAGETVYRRPAPAPGIKTAGPANTGGI